MNNSLFAPLKKKANLGFVVLIIPFVTFFLGYTIGYHQSKYDTENGNMNTQVSFVTKETKTTVDKNNVDLTVFWKIWDMIDASYIDTSKIDPQTMVYGAIKGLVASLKDPYTIYMDPKETEDFRNSLGGDLQGIGAELSIKNGHLVVVSPLKDSPAEKAGLRPGDLIYKIEDILADNLTLSDAVSKIRGKNGTTVKLTIIREKEEKPIELNIVRKEIKVPSVSWEMKENAIAYISVNQFGDDTTKEFSKAVNEILLKKPKGLVLDLRYNGGGYLDGAVDIVSEFIETGVVTTIKKRDADKKKEATEVQNVNGHARLEKIPLVILVNEGSASASEIVAGAIRDHKRGVLVGTKTFGKGSVQELEPLSDGSSLRMTIAKWYTPNNVNVHEVGIMPDVEIKNTDEDTKANKDTQLDKAISVLKEQLSK